MLAKLPLSPKQKLYIAVLIILFLFQLGFDFQKNYELWFSPSYISFVSLLGAVIALFRRNKFNKGHSERPLISILSNDYSLSNYASLRILSIIYAFFQGSLLGAGVGFICTGIGWIGSEYFGEGISYNLGYFVISLIVIVITRVSIEGTSLIFRVAEDISKSVNRDKN